MNQLMIRGHAPHGRLDDSYSVSDLRKPRPLYNFGIIDDAERKQQQERRQQAYLAGCDPFLSGSEFAQAPGSYNNSAAGNAVARTQRRQRQLRQRPPSNRQLMENHLRTTFGDELFDAGQYTVKDRVGIAGMPFNPEASSSVFQAMRARILGPLPRGTFAGCEGEDDSADEDDDDELYNASNVFAWCDRNNSAEDVAKTCARRAGAKITMRRGLPKWIFLYFRVRRVSWEFMVYEEKMNCSTVDLFSENVLDRWTVKLRFKMLLDAPMKYPLMSFLARMGLDTDPDIVFSTDGFFGDMLVGGLRNKNSIPHRQVSFNTTPEAMGLQNGDNIFVVKANSTVRNNVEAHIEMAKRRANKAEGEDEDEEEDDQEEEEDEK